MTQSKNVVRTMSILVAGVALTSGVLIATRPAARAPGPWRGDDLAIACMWWCAVVGCLWLAATTLACTAALARGHTTAAHRIARFAPPLARRILQTALVGTWALVPAVAYAAPPSAPITVHVDPRGHLTTETRRPAKSEAPIARAPQTTRMTTTTRGAPAGSTTTTNPTSPTLPEYTPSPITSHPRSTTPAPRPAPIAAPARTRVHVVVPGDNLWQIARAEVSRATATARPTDADIAPYWHRVVEKNRTTLRSGDPSLIFPGEIVALP